MEPIGLAGPKPAVLDAVLQIRVAIAVVHVFCLVLAGRAHCFCSVPEIGFGCFARDVIGGVFEVIGDRFRVRFDATYSLKPATPGIGTQARPPFRHPPR